MFFLNYSSLEYYKYSHTDKLLMFVLLMILIGLIIGLNYYYSNKKKSAEEIEEEAWPLYRSKDVLMQDKPMDDETLHDISSRYIMDDGSVIVKILLIAGMVFFILLTLVAVY